MREEYAAPLERRRPLVPGARRRRIVRAMLVAFAVVASAGLFVGTQSGRSTQVPLSDVLQRYEAASATDAPAPSDRSLPKASRRPGGGAPVVAVTAPPARADRRTGPYVRPSPGVYAFRADGGEQLSVFGASRTYPDRIYTTITHGDGCRWEGRMDVIEEHTDLIRACSEDGRLLHRGQTRTVRFFGITESIELICDPPQELHRVGEEAGGTTTHDCASNDGATATIERTLVGAEDIEIDGDRRPAVLHHLVTTFSGGTEGTSIDDMWLDAEHGMPLRWEREVDVDTDSAFGMRARYTEQASFELISLDPVRS